MAAPTNLGSKRMFKKILVANRGEIAIRVLRACREMGITGVAIYSEADRNSLHVKAADEAYCVGPAPSAESYLNVAKILEVAKQCGAEAIHPGYGFVSERAYFAKACADAGVVFIGPKASAIDAMGDKVQARHRMIAAGVPVVPGTDPLPYDTEKALAEVAEVGYPIMLKASAGGGGKGMRVVHSAEELPDALVAARAVSKSAFADDRVYAERYVEEPHHIEIQVLADTFGNTVHLFERECSIQRRHQKVVEETPSTFVSRELVMEMGEIAVRAAKAVEYSSAGTIEFLVDKYKRFYFLEMNTRLQVEHPVTEETTGVDLVKAQIRIAAGQPLGFTQKDLVQRGHAIEVRIYAEDPENNFLPSPGYIKTLTPPSGPGIRHDEGFGSDTTVPMYYDPMIAKLITKGEDRQSAISRMERALHEYQVHGIKTNISFLRSILKHPAFLQGGYDTGFIDHNSKDLFAPLEKTDPRINKAIALAAVALLKQEKTAAPSTNQTSSNTQGSRWKWADR
jgi:acetyl-CoA carboxylase biotin carboxylase subunit